MIASEYITGNSSNISHQPEYIILAYIQSCAIRTARDIVPGTEMLSCS